MFRLVLRSSAQRPSQALRATFKRHASYEYLHFQDLQIRPSRFLRFLRFSFGLVALTAGAYYLWWPKHTFPLPVAKILRKGIWAESDKGEKDFELALKHYLEALEECDQLGMDPLCDEYTGIQLKVGEMYERLDMMEEAAFTYNEIATLYLSVLKSPADSVQGKRIKDINHRAHLIRKDLRIALKLVQLNRANLLLSKAILITHLLIAQEEVNRKLGLAAGATSLLDSGSLTVPGLSSAETAKPADGELLVIETNPEAWEPFADEFFTGMDLLSAICIAAGDIKTATGIRISMTGKMILAGVSPEKLLLAQCNNASMFYLQADTLQADEQAMRRRFAAAAGVDYAKLKAIHDPLQPLSVGETEADAIRAKIAEVVSDEDKAQYEEIVSNKNNFLKMVVATYESVITGAKRLPAEVTKNNATISETVALATYGLGVVHLHLSEYDKAERLLREARVRSKACGYVDLIDEVESELQKLFNERKIIEAKNAPAS